MSTGKVRTRFAPSPTGRMHVGNLRTALYAYLIAKHEDGDFVLRIEDTDRERYMDEAEGIIYRTLEKTGLIHDEGPDKDGGVGPYVQSERFNSGLYLDYAKKLIEKGAAYYCFCDKERLESLKTTVAGKEIDDNAQYRIVTLDYVAQGNDHMEAFRSGTDIKLSTAQENNVRFIIMDFFRAKMAQGESVEGKLDGRITIEH